jgi:hypothetical protein
MLFIDGGTIYGGSRKAADYTTGTVTVTQGSKVVTGAGTAWLANVDAGMLLRLGATRIYVVSAVLGDTSLELFEAYEERHGSGPRLHALPARRPRPPTSAGTLRRGG